jgi:hypothetical protein
MINELMNLMNIQDDNLLTLKTVLLLNRILVDLN